MYHIQNPRGQLLTFSLVIPMCEAKVVVGGQSVLVLNKPRSLAQKPTAICFKREERFDEEHLYIGNLKPEQVSSILHTLSASGYYSFASFEYQNKRFLDDIVIDGGITLPYHSEDVREMAYFSAVREGPFIPTHECVFGLVYPKKSDDSDFAFEEE